MDGVEIVWRCEEEMKKEGFVVPIIVLTVICLVVAGLLAYVNSITAPVIAKAAALAEEEAKKEVLPEADSFTTVEDLTDCPATLESAYQADNGAGMVFILSGPGYGGQMQIIVGISGEKTVTGTRVLQHAETAGLGARITGEKFRDQFIGQDESLSGVELISGSTISSKEFRSLVTDAFAAYQTIAGRG